MNPHARMALQQFTLPKQLYLRHRELSLAIGKPLCPAQAIKKLEVLALEKISRSFIKKKNFSAPARLF
jgi:hypothetical protein